MMQARSTLLVGSPQWCHSTLHYLKTTWEGDEQFRRHWDEAWQEVESARIWERYPEDAPYGSPDALLRDLLGGDVDLHSRHCLHAGVQCGGLAGARRARYQEHPVGRRDRSADVRE